jgi:hypothetical protein
MLLVVAPRCTVVLVDWMALNLSLKRRKKEVRLQLSSIGQWLGSTVNDVQ